MVISDAKIMKLLVTRIFKGLRQRTGLYERCRALPVRAPVRKANECHLVLTLFEKVLDVVIYGYLNCSFDQKKFFTGYISLHCQSFYEAVNLILQPKIVFPSLESFHMLDDRINP